MCAPLRALPRICSRALPCTLCAPRSPATSRLPARTSSRTVCPPFDSRQSASAFNQPLSFDTSSVTDMGWMFYVRSSPSPAPNLHLSPALHAACTAIARRLPPPGPHLPPASYALLATRQNIPSLSDANKRLIRCAWAGTSAFASCGYNSCSGWGSGTCPAPFTTKASLVTAVQEFNGNPTAAGATYGPIAGWDVSAITDMSEVFSKLQNFDADISSWDTSKVTKMYKMFQVRSSQSALEPSPARCVHRGGPPPPAAPGIYPSPLPTSYALLSTLGRARRRSTSR